MAVWGKVLGAFFGFLLAGPFGLFLGFYLGHKLDKARASVSFGARFSGKNQHENQQAYFHATFSVMGHIAKAKGQVTQNEIRLAMILMDRMALDTFARRKAQDAFREGKTANFPLEDVLDDVKRSCGGRFDLLQLFLELQIQAAYADGHLHQSELDVLQIVANKLGFSASQLAQIIAMQEAAFHFYQQGEGGGQQQWSPAYSAARLEDAYKILGVEPGASTQSIKRAYRKQMNEHHPDKLAARGLPPEMMEMAKQKAQDIQAAYDIIKKEQAKKE